MIRLCKQYDEISDKVQEMPNNTADLVALTQYVEHASTALVMKLQTSVDEAAERLAFMLDYATLSCEYYSGFYMRLVIVLSNVSSCIKILSDITAA